MLLIIGALINMEIKVVYIVIHDAIVDRYVSALWKCFSIAEKTSMCRGQVVGVTRCSDHDGRYCGPQGAYYNDAPV